MTSCSTLKPLKLPTEQTAIGLILLSTFGTSAQLGAAHTQARQPCSQHSSVCVVRCVTEWGGGGGRVGRVEWQPCNQLSTGVMGDVCVVCVCVGGGGVEWQSCSQHCAGRMGALGVCVCGGGGGRTAVMQSTLRWEDGRSVCVCVGGGGVEQQSCWGGGVEQQSCCQHCDGRMGALCVCVCVGGGVEQQSCCQHCDGRMGALCVCVCVWGGGGRTAVMLSTLRWEDGRCVCGGGGRGEVSNATRNTNHIN